MGCSFCYLSSPSKGQVLIVGYVALMLYNTVCLSKTLTKTIYFLSQFKNSRHGFKSVGVGVCFCDQIIFLFVGCSFCNISSPSKAQLLIVCLCGADALYSQFV